MKTISITIEQAKIALECIEESISMSEFSALEYDCIETLRVHSGRVMVMVILLKLDSPSIRLFDFSTIAFASTS